MDWLLTLGIAVGLAMDAFAVSIATGIRLSNVTGRHVFRMAFHFGLFQFLMPIIGGLCGHGVARFTQTWGPWIAFALLAFIGGKMFLEAGKSDPEDENAQDDAPSTSSRRGDPTRGFSLIVLSIATSLDALTVGFGFALLNRPILLPSIIIGLTACFFSVLGIRFGASVGTSWGHIAERFGGVVLMGLGVYILFF
jgi:manganese efflux pump family protein